MALLIQLLFRLAFGLAAGMSLVSPRQVSSGYYRNHLYVTLGVASLAGLLARGISREALFCAIAAAVLSYVGSVCWLYEYRPGGVAALAAVAAVSFVGALSMVAACAPLASPAAAANIDLSEFRYAQALTSGLLLGATMAAMLLGHWYLNSPGMQLAPLRRLLIAMAIAVCLQALLCGVGAALQIARHGLAMQLGLFLLLRWSFGLAGVAVLIALAWQTLKIPNTQSATGILYVAVIGVFVGETMSLLLSAESVYPV